MFEQEHKFKKHRKFIPLNDIYEVIENLQRRMDLYELEALIKERSLEDIVKFLLMHGEHVTYLKECIYEKTCNDWKGLIFKKPISTHSRMIKRLYISNMGNE
jgi:hypothetical protein